MGKRSHLVIRAFSNFTLFACRSADFGSVMKLVEGPETRVRCSMGDRKAFYLSIS